ncbi:MAG TPA: hypothetical protein VHZ76_04075 [Gammaproteobacteria bacterium]|jgi:hypothetical protein|nr:hypothetical protein [Gammaproteobacteria bacterium]
MDGLIYFAGKEIIKNLIVGYLVNNYAIPSIGSLTKQIISNTKLIFEPVRHFVLSEKSQIG